MIILSPSGKFSTSWNGKHLTYILADIEYKNKTLWFQPLDGEAPRKRTGFGDEEISETSRLGARTRRKKLCFRAGRLASRRCPIEGLEVTNETAMYFKIMKFALGYHFKVRRNTSFLLFF